MKILCVRWMTYLWIVLTTLQLNAQQKKPNILVIFGDDIGYWNISAYNSRPFVDLLRHLSL